MSTHHHSQCHALLSTISEYVDGSLSPEFCEELERHLAECENCHVVVDTLRKTISLYHQTADETAQMPGVVRERLYRTLNLEDFRA
jgi:anti-sigma factor RsiW